jgi:hypothetical protein
MRNRVNTKQSKAVEMAQEEPNSDEEPEANQLAL